MEAKTRNGLYGFEYLEEDKRRVPEGTGRKFEIKQLWQRSHEIINLAARGLKNTDIAEIMGVSPWCVSATLNSRLGQLKLSELREARDEEAKKTVEKIRILTNKAINTYNEIFDDKTGAASLKDKKSVADTVLLELSGLRVPTKIQSHSLHTQLSAEELERFRSRGIQAARESGVINPNQGTSE